MTKKMKQQRKGEKKETQQETKKKTGRRDVVFLGQPCLHGLSKQWICERVVMACVAYTAVITCAEGKGGGGARMSDGMEEESCKTKSWTRMQISNCVFACPTISAPSSCPWPVLVAK